jgi:molybdenum cofactor biosynthesis enzyme MoaA
MNTADIFSKNRNRAASPEFANINLLARCNANCFFCLGKDLGDEIANRNDTTVHFSEWANWEKFLVTVKEAGVRKVYLTGQNTDSLLYRYLDELIDELHRHDFGVGLRTNGALAIRKMDSINKCELSAGYSIHSLNAATNRKIMGWNFIPDWDTILTKTRRSRVAMVLNRFNIGEFYDIVSLVSRYPNVRYMQARRISTDDRQKELLPDVLLYEELFADVARKYEQIGEFFGAATYDVMGVPVTFWRTVKTDISSINYFTDGTISDVYFVVEGYRLNREKRDNQ